MDNDTKNEISKHSDNPKNIAHISEVDHSPDSNNQSPVNFGSPDEDKSDRLPRNKFLRYLKIFAICAVLFIIISIATTIIREQIGKSNQQKKYQAAKARCGKDPVVVVEHYIQFGWTSYEKNIYTPTNPGYESQKAIYNNGLLSFGYDKVEGYYCTIKEANSVPGTHADDQASNYTQEQQDNISQSILSVYSDEALVIPYEMKSIPSTLKLKSKTVNKPHDKSEYDDKWYEPYEYVYTSKNSNKDDKRKVTFKCASYYSDLQPKWLSPADDKSVKYKKIFEISGKNPKTGGLYNPEVNAGYLRGNDEKQGWVTDFFYFIDGKSYLTRCVLIDEQGLVLRSEGDKLMTNLQKINLNELTNTTLIIS